MFVKAEHVGTQYHLSVVLSFTNMARMTKQSSGGVQDIHEYKDTTSE